MASGKRQLIAVVLLVLGIGVWLTQPSEAYPGWEAGLGAAIGLIIAVTGSLNRSMGLAVARMRRGLKSHPTAATTAVGIAAGAYLLFEACRQPSEMFLRIHDEHSYMIQARMLAHGWLWTRGYSPAIAPFFDTFYVFVERVYASIYFPGTALAVVPTVWLHLPYWTTPLICGAGGAAVFYCIVARLFDGVRGMLAALMLITRPYFRMMSLMLLSETPALLANLLMVWAWMRWRKRRHLRWAALLGAVAGWAGIIRPLDAICFAVPVGIAIAFELRGQPKLLLKTGAVLMLFAMPFAALQTVQNIGITGSWRQPPEESYIAHNFPGPGIGFGPYDLTRPPAGMSEPRWDFAYDQFDAYRNHTLGKELANWYSNRFTQFRYVALPATFMVIFFPLALVRMGDIRRKVVAAGLVLFLAGYMACVFRLYFYQVPAIPAAICVVFMGWEALERAWPRQRRRLFPLIALAIAGFAIWCMPELNSDMRRLPAVSEQLKWIDADLSGLSSPAVVLFRYDTSRIPLNSFPVFNDDVPWPDDAKVVRANDLGEGQNWKLYDYYARFQPERRVYEYVRSRTNDPQPLKYLGTVGELAARHGGQAMVREPGTNGL
jgi:dolichyl-phosphate-mannose-protein mannosyltransferase